MPAGAARPRFDGVALLLVMAGGAVGALLRWVLAPDMATSLLPLIAINVAGSALLGLVVGVLGDENPRRRAFLGTGVLGGFTSYSGLAPFLGAYGLTALTSGDGLTIAVLAVLATAALAGAACALGGLVAGERLVGRRS